MERIHVDGQSSISDMARTVSQSENPVLLFGDGYGDMVVMSAEAYENFMRDIVIWSKLREAEIEEEYDDTTYTHEEVFAAARAAIGGGSAA